MRYLLLFTLLSLATLMPAQVRAQTSTPTPPPIANEVVKTACAASFGYATLEALKADVLVQAKRLAVNELFGEFITASTAVENFVVTDDQIRSLTSGFVRVRSEDYHHGSNLGDVCVTINAYVTAEDRALFEPVRLSKRQCVTDSNLTVSQIRAFAQEESLVQMLIEYDRKLADQDHEKLLSLLQRVEYSDMGFVSETETYCVTAQGDVTPVEVMALLEGMETSMLAETSATPSRTPTARATSTPTPRSGATLTAPEKTAVSFAATATAFANRTATFTPTATSTPNSTATAVALMVDVLATAEAAPHHIYDVWVNPVDDAVYVYVPEGEFTMGSGDGGADEQPVHRVYLDAFWIMRTEVTNAQYDRCVRAGICTAPNNSTWRDVRYADHPVTDVDWTQASVYATWVGGDLPTEAQWEKACRGDDLRTYPWGNQEPSADYLNFAQSGIGETTAVGSYPAGASPYGAMDMAGNVEEWVFDWFDIGYYANSPDSNPTGPADGDGKAGRGGAFAYDSANARCASRISYFFDLTSQAGTNGFRVMVGSDTPFQSTGGAG